MSTPIDWKNLPPCELYKHMQERVEQSYQKPQQVQALARVGRSIFPEASFFESLLATTFTGCVIQCILPIPPMFTKVQLNPTESVQEQPALKSPLFIARTAIGSSLLFGMIVYFFRRSQLSLQIQKVFEDLHNPDVSTETALVNAINVHTTVKNSLFTRIYCFWNPSQIGCLLLTKAIALDSQKNHREAQQEYDNALNLPISHDLRYTILASYVRSLRLQNKEAEKQLEKIDASSPQYALGLLFNKLTESEYNRYFDRAGVPWEFMCGITQEIMENPVAYTKKDCRFHGEKRYIESWSITKGVCPYTNDPLEPNELVEDKKLAATIRIWSQIKLKETT